MPREPIERILSKWRVASRTEARRLVSEGRVRVGGRALRDPRAFVDPAAARIEVDGKRVEPVAVEPVYVLLNKPRGVVTTTRDPEGRPTVMDLVREHAAPGLAPVGRLDRASAGALLLTNDATLADRLLDPRSHVRKRYRVKVRGRLEEQQVRSLREDTVEEAGLVLGPMEVRVESRGPRSTWLAIALREGKNRQIRRRIEDLGLSVEVLVRTHFGPLALGTLAPGRARRLEAAEVAALRRAGGSTGLVRS